MPNCIAHSQVLANYICTECVEGYELNSEVQCLECSEGYEIISENSLECVIKIERCSEYTNIDGNASCKECRPGYKLSSSGLCDECNERYLQILGNNIECIAEILNRIDYDTSSQYPKCIICEAGYMIDSYNKCSSCEIEYFEVSNDPLECAYERDRCISYEKYQGEWVCDICKKGYRLDIEMKCNLCADGYIANSQEVLDIILILKIIKIK